MAGDAYLPGGGGAQVFVPRRNLGGLGMVIVLHLLLLWALVSGLAQRAVEIIKAPIQAKLIQEAPAEPPPPPPPLPAPPRAPVPTMEPLPAPAVVPVVPVLQNNPPPAQPVAPVPPVAPPPVAAPPTEAVRVQAAPPPPTPQAAAPAVKPEDVYLSQLRSYVNSIKRYPTSREARQLRPQGTVRVWVELDRAGQLLGTGVEASSGSLLLDNEALRTLRNGRFPPFPPEAFAGQGSHRFVMSVEYQTEGG
jgi:protein TonB